MVCKYEELTTFIEVAEAFDGKVYCQKLSIKCTVPYFWRMKLPRKVANWLPPITNILLQDSSDHAIRSVGHDACCGLGRTRNVALAKASLMAVKAAVVLSSQAKS